VWGQIRKVNGAWLLEYLGHSNPNSTFNACSSLSSGFDYKGFTNVNGNGCFILQFTCSAGNTISRIEALMQGFQGSDTCGSSTAAGI